MKPGIADTVSTLQKKKRGPLVHRFLLVLSVMVLLCVIALLAADLRVERRAAGRVYDAIEDVPAREYGLLPGTSRLVRGKYLNTYFYNRIRAAAELYRAGKVRKIIVSGDTSPYFCA